MPAHNNKIILGTVQMGIPYGINNKTGKISEEESHQILKYAYEAGIHTLDTAEAYGEAHAIIGSFHRENPDIRFKVITKLPHNFKGNIENTVKNYCEVLCVEQLEAIMFHSYTTFTQHTDSLDELVDLKSQNLIKLIGVSIYNNNEFEDLLNYAQIDLIQLPFNLLDNVSQKGNLLNIARENNKVIHSRSAFLQGIFFKDIEDPNPVVQALKKELQEIHTIATTENLEISSLALNYCLQIEAIDNVLIGVDSLNQLIENLTILGKPISSDSINRINKIVVADKNLLNPSLWK
ncbi:aldo/keto reductase [Emticicia agri]|uniref:Aldo/keto reductase n=1 Tax=Emticicia agri TaxID=2492393 RepID=A0A4Q5LTK7_9BACT|nr:aldo/keto reductase [Emticicia agri]RYU92902.1 aldo/keto reductase [Emticicia agri]